MRMQFVRAKLACQFPFSLNLLAVGFDASSAVEAAGGATAGWHVVSVMSTLR